MCIRDSPKGPAAYKRTAVCDGASIEANATIVCGHRGGTCALIGAGAGVTCDVPDHALMLGVPAKQRGWVCACGELLSEGLECAAVSYTHLDVYKRQDERSGMPSPNSRYRVI